MSKNKLEQEFGETIKQINDKIKEAGESLRTANELAKQAGLNLLNGNSYGNYHEDDDEDEDMEDKRESIETYPLFKAMREAGWSTSSLSC